MTVTYIQHVLNGGKFGAFLRLLFMWRGSVYKATGINLIIFISLYTIISLLYRYLLIQDEQYKLGRWSLFSTRVYRISTLNRGKIRIFFSSILGRIWVLGFLRKCLQLRCILGNILPLGARFRGSISF